MEKQIVTGLASFDKIASGEALYVDKTLFAKDVFHSGSEAMLILRPRRWGKSLNMAMLKYFLEAPIKKESQNPGEIDLEKLEEKKAFFKDKKVLLENPEMTQHLGKYSVISISLGGIQAETKLGFIKAFNMTLSSLFRSFSFLSSQLLENEKHLFNLFSSGQAGLEETSQSLAFLSSLLARVYQRPIWLLLDEYDATVNTVWEKALKKESDADELLNSLVQFFGSFYETSVKGNENIYRTLFTGVFRVLKGSMGTSMNNFQEYSLLDEFFDRDFGFTREEIRMLLNEIGIPKENHPKKLKEASDWYNGYQSTGGPIYNPWSIMYWLKKGKVEAYWVNMGSLDIILGISQYHSYTEELSQLVLGKNMEGNLLWGLVLRQCTPESSRLKNAFWTLLVFSGYISMEQKVEDRGDQILCRFKLPNLELRRYFKYCLTDDFQNRYNIDQSVFKILIQALLDGKIDAFEKQLKSFFRRVVSTYDVGENRIEAFYQGFFLGMIASCDEHYVIRSEFPSGMGRGDLFLIPREGLQRKWKEKKPALILEYKVAEKKAELHSLAREALSQIQDKDYLAEVEGNPSVEACFSVGLSFYKKDCVLKWSQWNR